MQKLEITSHDSSRVDPRLQAAALRFRFERTTCHELAKQDTDVDVFEDSGSRVALRTSELQQLVDQVREPVGFLANAGERRLAVSVGFGEFDGEPQPRQGRS